MLSLMLGRNCLLLWLIWVSGCWGQSPNLTLSQFASGCPIHAVDNVRVEGVVDLKSVVDPANYSSIDITELDHSIISSKSLASCANKGSSLSCTKTSNTYFNVVYEAPANEDLSKVNVKIQTYHIVNVSYTDSNSVLYPFVKNKVKDVLLVNNTNLNVTVDDVEVTHIVSGIITVSYSITGPDVSPADVLYVRILKLSSDVIASSTTKTVSANIDTELDNCVYVSYSTTFGCSSGNNGKIKLCFSEQTTTTEWPNTASGRDDSNGCGPGCIAGLIVGVVLVVLPD